MLQEDTDSANQALCAAIRMLTAVENLNQARGKEGSAQLGVGIGIATGPVSLGVLGSQNRKSITVIGNHVNLAARLQGMAKASQVVIDTNTFASIDKYKQHFTQRSLELKGFSELQDVYHLDLAEVNKRLEK
jgi:adenylate cyclase